MSTDQTKYPLEITNAINNVSAASLLANVGAKTSIAWERSDSDLWASKTVDGQTTIYYAKTARPAESLAHELLHAEQKLMGYRQYNLSVAKAPCQSLQLVSQLLTILDNELQHHRIADRFASCGFNLKHFYHDGDKNTYKKARRVLQDMNSANSAAEFFTQFVTVIAPGGEGSDKERRQLRTFLMLRCGTKHEEVLTQIEGIFANWRASISFNAGPFIQQILSLLRLPGSFWIGASTSFPADGFFVGDSFTIAEAQKLSN